MIFGNNSKTTEVEEKTVDDIFFATGNSASIRVYMTIVTCFEFWDYLENLFKGIHFSF